MLSLLVGVVIFLACLSALLLHVCTCWHVDAVSVLTWICKRLMCRLQTIEAVSDRAVDVFEVTRTTMDSNP